MWNIYARTVDFQHRERFTTVATTRVSRHSRVCWSNSPALAVASVMLLSVLGTGSASADPTLYLFSVVNPSATTAQTDLRLMFSTNILVDKNNNPIGVTVSNLTTTSLVANSNGKGIDFTGKPQVNASGMGATPAAGSTMGGVVSLVPGNTMFTNGTFTDTLGKAYNVFDPKLLIIVGKKDNGEVDITNTDTQTIYFENVDADTNIPSSDFVDPSAAQLSDDFNNQLYAQDSEPNFSLAPGAAETLALGPDLGDNYTAVVFTASFDPSFSFSDSITEGFASDVEIPEPASLLLLSTGLVAAWWMGRRIRA